MSARDDDHTIDNLDLTALLWGEAPSWPSPSTASPSEPSAPSPPPVPGVEAAVDAALPAEEGPLTVSTPRGDDGAWAVPEAWPGIQEEPLAYEADAGAEDDGLDMAALDALGALALDAFASDDDDPDDPVLPALSEGKELGVGALTDRLEREVMPRLRRYLTNPGYLSLGHLAYAVAALHGSDAHLERVRVFAEQVDVPIVPTRSHHLAHNLTLAAIEETQRRFGDLLRGTPGEHVVITRAGYAGLRLTKAARAFLMQAWMEHCLSRVEERRHIEIVAAEIERVGTEVGRWSEAALASREALILDNLLIVAREARAFIGRGVEIDDLHQMGSLGLFRAVEKFDASRHFRFVTYASNWVYQSIQRGVGDQGRFIRLPVHMQEQRKLVEETAALLLRQTGILPTPERVAEECEIPIAVTRKILFTSRPVSLDRQGTRTGSAALLRSMHGDVEAIVEQLERSSAIQEAMTALSAREAEVLELRFGLVDDREMTLEEVARRPEFRLTRERIRQIEYKALEKLRHPGRQLPAFEDFSHKGRKKQSTPRKVRRNSSTKNSSLNSDEVVLPDGHRGIHLGWLHPLDFNSTPPSEVEVTSSESRPFEADHSPDLGILLDSASDAREQPSGPW